MAQKYNLYIDESGVANLCDHQSKFFVLSAIVIEEKINRELAAYFSFIKKRYKLPEEKNFHTVGLFEDRKSDFYLSDSKCKSFCFSLAEFIETSPLLISASCINKDYLRQLLKMPEVYGFKGSKEHNEDKDIGYEILARQVFLEFSKFLKQKNAQGTITAESRRGADYQLLKTFLFCQEPNQFNHSVRLRGYSQELRQRVFSIRFENKQGLNAGLEMADIISYLAYQKAARNLAASERRGSKILWRAIEKKSDLKNLSSEIMNRFAKNRIHEIATRIEERLRKNSDLVNPTLR